MEEHQPLTLLCLSHLPWDHVWQRPQQLMTRFARHCRVIYVDPPALTPRSVRDVEQIAGAQGAMYIDSIDQAGVARRGMRAYLQERPVAAGVRVLRPIFPDGLLGTPGNSYQELWLSLLSDLLVEAGPNTMLWVFSPLADYLVAAAQPRVKLAVYDCMDDLASFRSATDERQRETHLMELVDLVFTGGYSMYEARKERHPRVHCFPSGVDIAHYRRVRDAATIVPASIACLPCPRLGYFGVLDERIDWPLIAELAVQRPAWQWVLVGPTAKIDPAELPVAPNIHYLGQQQYADLPGYLKGFDIATMPFALNQHTRFISPTKTLEYLAGGKPVISSSVPDVVAAYDEIVYLADGPGAWLQTIEQVLTAPEEELQARLDRAAPILAQSSWEDIAERMWALIEERLAAQGLRAGGQGSVDEHI